MYKQVRKARSNETAQQAGKKSAQQKRRASLKTSNAASREGRLADQRCGSPGQLGGV